METIPVTLVIASRFPLLSLAICTESLRVANREVGAAAFRCTIATVDGASELSSSGIPIQPDLSIQDIAFAPVVIVLTSYEPERACHPKLLSWLRRQDRRGAIIGCVDTGAYVLARAGLLRGERIAVHHEAVPAYRETLGEAVLLDRLHAFEARRASSAGGMATLDMMLDLIARLADPALADRVAHIMNYARLPDETARPAQSGDGAIARTDPRLGRLVELMQTHVEDPLPVERLCRLARVDGSTAQRLFQRRFGTSPGRYYTKLRLERARSLLQNSALSVAEIAGLAGFADASAFSRAYRRAFGILPSKGRQPRSGSLV